MKPSMAVVVVLWACYSPLHAQVVLFADPELKAAVEVELGVFNPTVDDMEGLTELAVVESNISDLTGLETAVNLVHLAVTHAQVSDLSPLSGLTNLRSLWMDGNPISNLSPLAGLTNLTLLQLYSTSIRDLSPLSGLTNLSRLYLGSYQINDLGALSGLTSLTNLAVYGGQVSDISPLTNLTALTGLWLNYNQISDVGPLSGLTSLKTLDLFQNQVSDISPLVGLTGLLHLDLRNNPLNQEACDVYIPQIETNGTSVNYDPCVTVPVPDVVGLSQLAAKEILQDQGFAVRIVAASSETVLVGYVISQVPPGGTMATVGSDVTLTISTGPDGAGPELPLAVSHWMLDETEGLIAADSVGNHDGRVRGDPVWLSEGGVLGGALWFDGIDDYVDCGTFDPSEATGKLTACLWARWNGPTGWYQVLIAKRDAWASDQMMWQIEADPVNGMVGLFSTTGGYRHAFELPVDQWVHIAASCDGVTMTFYRDGGQVISSPMTFDSDTSSAVIIGAGQPNGENPFLGTLDDIRLYDELLNPEQIRAVRASAETIHWIRAAYWDQCYPTSWLEGTTARDALVSAGYAALNAQELAGWMEDRIADSQPSVVVFCQDIAPDTVFQEASSSCALRRYLDAGGKVLWYGDIPFYYQGHNDGSRTTFGVAGALGVLGLNAGGGTWDITEPVTLTYEGRAWGLTQIWSSGRPAWSSGSRVLAYDLSGQAAAWVKHYVPGDTYAGFVRFHDTGGTPSVQDIQRLAEYPNFQCLRSERLLAHYPFEGNLHDDVGGYHGMAVGNPGYCPGVIGQALDLEGAGDYVDCGNGAILNPASEISVAAWINARTIPAEWTGLVTKGDTAWRLCTWQDERRICFAVTESDYVLAANRLRSNQWYHLCATYDGAAIRIYIDGVEAGSEPYNGQISSNSNNVWIGGYSGHPGREWDGLIDELCIYDRALDPAEVMLLATP